MEDNIFNILKKHFEFKDNWGNNSYMPKEKLDALQKELEAYSGKRYKDGLREGNTNMLVGIEELFESIVDHKKKEVNLSSDQHDSIKSYFKWHRKFLDKKDNE